MLLINSYRVYGGSAHVFSRFCVPGVLAVAACAFDLNISYHHQVKVVALTKHMALYSLSCLSVVVLE